MKFDLSGKRALVTGASGGLGLHFSRVLASAGAEVTLAARRVDRVRLEADKLGAIGLLATGASLDVTNEKSILRLFASSRSFDIVVNNAGISGARAALEQCSSEFRQVLETNLTGAFTVAQTAARGMKDAGGGTIVNVASIVGIRVTGHLAAYAASKAGLIQLTRSLALEWARFGIRVNALCPGYVKTPINAEFLESRAGAALARRIPQRRLGQPSDLDGPLLLLASDHSDYMTGSVLTVDGGHLVTGL